jgi:hypothetical protein
MFPAMSLSDFDREVKTILVREFEGILDLGLMSEEALIPVVAGIRSSLREAFPSMSPKDVEFHLKQLQDQCRDTAYSIFHLAYTDHWN